MASELVTSFVLLFAAFIALLCAILVALRMNKQRREAQRIATERIEAEKLAIAQAE